MTSLRILAGKARDPAARRLRSVDADVSLSEILSRSYLDLPIERLRGRSVLIATDEQFATACALIACDGVAARMVICPPDLSAEHMGTLASVAAVDLVLCDDAATRNPLPGIEAVSIRSRPTAPLLAAPRYDIATEWIMPTSGTSGTPKLVIHTLQTLAGAMTGGSLGTGAVWSTFYDIRRYGGMQIFLRAMYCGGSLTLSSASEPVAAFLARAHQNGVTHISGTPSHWRRALMSPDCRDFAPHYVRLSGEIVDQTILDRLRAIFPESAISHAFASTEAGVAFDVTDGLAGFPATLIGSSNGVAMRIEGGSLRIRSSGNAKRYLGESAQPICDAEGFVDTGDMVERKGDRYVFIGRRSGIINIGGLKIHPEEVEAIIAEHPRVRMCVVKARRSPITGAIVAAEIVADRAENDPEALAELKDEIIAHCRDRLPRHKVPVTMRLVSNLDIAGSGKMRR